jgi:mono/diheme cytochrome c family protein
MVCVLVFVASVVALRAQSSQDHAYTTQDIQTGSRLYAGQCAQCHGPNGDTVSGINLRRGQFRRPLSDDDLRRTISVGVPGAGMPPFNFQPAELDGLVAFVRAGFDVGGGAVRIGEAARGQTAVRGQRRVHQLSSRERQRPARGARPERHRRSPPAQPTITDRAGEADDADESAGRIVTRDNRTIAAAG